MVSKKERADYEEGLKDNKKGALDQVIIDITGNHPGTPAYYKGRSGEQLDGDRKPNK